MPLIHLDDVSLAFGDQPLLKHASMTLEPGERVCLIGRNGAGKSTLQKLIMRQTYVDDGEIRFQQNLRISRLDQLLPTELDIRVDALVKSGLEQLCAAIDQYEALSHQPSTRENLQQLEQLQMTIETNGGWEIDRQVETTMTQLNLPAELTLRELSGGWQRRALLGKALVSKPDLLLLDEPTNHLDIQTIEWLEQTIKFYAGCVLFITHDRLFLQRLATRIIELDRGHLSSWPGDYDNFLRHKAELLEAEATQDALFDKKLDQEEIWIRQGVKARRTRNEGRVRALEALRREYSARLPKQRKAKIALQESEASGRQVIQARNLNYKIGERVLLKDFSLKIMRGDRIGIIGNNGVGKTTLLELLLGKRTPDSGNLKLGTQLQVGYFSQIHAQLDLDKTISETVGDGRDYLQFNGKDRHVIGYLRDFLFSAKRAMTPIKALSGGERNRVVLAKLFTQPANLLILDEPTNDLDVDMLEVLEERLVEYDGTLIVVSHDRQFIDNVVTSTLVFEEDGKVHHYVGGYSDWLKYQKQLAELENPKNQNSNSNKPMPVIEAAPVASNKPKLSYKLQRELDNLPTLIANLEAEIATLQAKMSDADFYQQSHAKQQPILQAISNAQLQLEQAMTRWIELDG
jgi:ATP-binding cassette subfamily F protein uup